jgi:hypothetical protein
MTLAILGTPTADLAHAQAWARQANGKRLDQVDKLLEEFWRLGPKVGIDPAVAAAQSSEETGGWTSAIWVSRLNPAGLDVEDDRDAGLGWPSGTEAAQAQLVHLAIYAKGYRGAQQMIRYLHQDPDWHDPIAAGFAGTAKTVDDLSGRWASDANYGDRIEGHWKAITGAIVTPGPTPGTEPPQGIVWKATGNWNYRTVDRPIFVVRHVTDDLNLQNTISWFQNPRSQASSHFVIDRDGTIYQFVSSLDYAWTNGDVNNPRTDIPALTKAIRSGKNLNDWCVTIEHVATPETGITDAQFKRTVELGRYLNARYEIPPHRYGQLRHSDINSVGRSYCPGPKFPLEQIIRELGGDPAKMAA